MLSDVLSFDQKIQVSVKHAKYLKLIGEEIKKTPQKKRHSFIYQFRKAGFKKNEASKNLGFKVISKFN
jgi:hypothetical protein